MLVDRLLRQGILFTGSVLLIVGCGQRAASGLAPVSGKVSYQGRPLHTGTVVFTPDSVRGTTGELARGEIQPDGTYRLKSGEQMGTVPGTHRVTVIAIEQGPAGATPQSLLPSKYRDPELSGLSCEVVPGRENTINFNLQ